MCTMTTSSNFREYQAAVYLNNLGVSFLRRKCFQQALDTMHDAVTLMKQAHGTESCGRRTRIEDALNRSCQRSARAVPATDDDCCNRLQIHPITDDLYKEPPYSVSIVCPIVLEDMHGPEDRRSYDYESAVLVYNYGLAYYALSKFPRDETVTKMMMGASKLLQLANTILDIHLNKCEQDDEIQKAAFVNFIVLKKLVLLMHEMGRGQPLDLDERLELLGEILQSIDSPISMNSERKVTAPAA